MEMDVSARSMPNGEGFTLEKVWAMFQETDRKLQEVTQIVRENMERQKKTDRQFNDLRDEINRIIQEADKKSNKSPEYTTEIYPQTEETLDDEEAAWVEEINREIYEKFANNFGNLSDHLVSPFIERKFRKMGFNWTSSWNNYSVIDPENSNDYASIDILLESTETVMAINVKENINEDDVDKHIKRMEILRRAVDKRQDKRKYRGAIAAVKMNETVREYMLQNGLYVLKQSGKTIEIDIPDNFIPKEW